MTGQAHPGPETSGGRHKNHLDDYYADSQARPHTGGIVQDLPFKRHPRYAKAWRLL